MFVQTKFALTTLASIVLIGANSPAVPVTAGAVSYAVPLTGHEEVNIGTGTAGDLDASGMVRLAVDPGKRQICYDFSVSGLSTPLMAHIHRGSSQNIGPSVVTLFTGPGGELDGCLDWTRERLAEIVANPSNFYVNLATTEFPDGAIRGQLQA